jgi:hypothetical protein
MKKLNKTLLAGALIVAAGSANATLTNGSTTGTNEAYLVAFDANYVNSDLTLGRSFNLDLGTTFAALQANAGAALSSFVGATNNLASNANWLAFTTLGAGEAAQAISYGIYAAGDTTTQANNGIFVSGLSAPVAPLATAGTTPVGSTTTWGGQIGAINIHSAEINLGLASGATSSVIKGTDASSTGQANSIPDFATMWGAGLAPLASYGSANNLYYGATHLGSVVARGKTTTGVALLAQSDISNVGSFTLAGNTLSFTAAGGVSAVPLPAAVWMFGAGLMSMLRINRRKLISLA